jgi:beta-glucuronidase
MQVAELTDIYSLKTQTTPVWKTVIDPQWLDKGEHDLRIDAETLQGLQIIETKKIQGTKQDTKHRISLTGEWNFAEMSDLPVNSLEGSNPAVVQPGFKEGKWTKIFVPNSLGTVNEKWNNYEGIIGVYRRNANIDLNKNEQAFIVLESSYWSARVFINGIEAGETHGGYLPSRFEITKILRQGNNEIAIIVDNRFSTMGVFKRLNEFYWNWGGITQELHIEKHTLVSFSDLRAEGSMNGNLKLHINGLNATANLQQRNLTVEVYNKAGKKVIGPVLMKVDIPAGSGILKLKDLKINNPVRWDMDNPYLYTVVVKGEFGIIKERTGFRDVKVQGSDILLNGKPLQGLQGFNRHADYPGLGRTQPAGLAYEELKMLRDKGFRFFRPAHYPTTPATLDAADELGLLVIEEINVTGLKGAVMATKEVKDFGIQQLTKMINRDRSHPSIIAWSVGNENFTEQEGAAEYVREVITVGRSLDPNRLYTQVTHRHTSDKTFEFQDFVAQNYYAGWYAKDINAIVNLFDAIQSYAGNKPIMLSEYGAEAVSNRSGTAKSSEFYQGFVVDAHNRLLNNRKHFVGKMYWCSTEFWCRPNWHGGSPDPVPPFHVKSLIGISREHKKLGWRVIFSPVRLLLNPHTVKANELGGDIIVPADKDTTISQVITIREIKGVSVKGKLLLELPKGFESATLEYPFHLKPDEGKSFTITFKGMLAAPNKTTDCFIKAVIDNDTEAQPLLLTLKTKEQ